MFSIHSLNHLEDVKIFSGFTRYDEQKWVKKSDECSETGVAGASERHLIADGK